MSELSTGDTPTPTIWDTIPDDSNEAAEFLAARYNVDPAILGRVTKGEKGVISIERSDTNVPPRIVELTLKSGLSSEARFGGDVGFDVPSIATFLQNLYELDKNIELTCGQPVEPVLTLTYRSPDDRQPQVTLLYRHQIDSCSLQSSMAVYGHNVNQRLLMHDDFRDFPVEPIQTTYTKNDPNREQDINIWVSLGRNELRIQMRQNETRDATFPSRFAVFIPGHNRGSVADLLDNGGNEPFPWQLRDAMPLETGPVRWS